MTAQSINEKKIFEPENLNTYQGFKDSISSTGSPKIKSFYKNNPIKELVHSTQVHT